jgi:hypothetical protein
MLHIPPSRLYSHKGIRIKENKKIGKGEVEKDGKQEEAMRSGRAAKKAGSY